MKKTFVSIAILLVSLSIGTINTNAQENSEPQQTFTNPYKREPGYGKKIIFPNGYMAYFERVDDTGDKIDTSGYVSGVYDNSIPRKLLYEIEYSFSEVFGGYQYKFSSTGVNYMMFRRNFNLSLQDPSADAAITFFSSGEIVKEYTLEELFENSIETLVEQEKLVNSPDGAYWIESYRHDLVNNLLHVKTVEDQYISFDLNTGDIVSRFTDNPFSDVTIGSSVVITGDEYYSHDNISGVPIPTWVKCVPHTVAAIEGDRVLLDGETGVNSWVHKSSIISYPAL